MKFQKFGWNGLLFIAPQDIRFNRFGGNAKAGTLRLEAEDYFIEAKWEPIPKRRQSISTVADKFIESMSKEYSKKLKRSKKDSFQILRKEVARVYMHDALYLIVKADAEEHYYIWYCDESKRVIILRLVFRIFDNKSKNILTNILDGFECHRKETTIWTLLNTRFETPIDFLLTDVRIAVGRAHFMLSDRKPTPFMEKISTIVVEYFSMANVIYKDTLGNLNNWFERHYDKDLKKLLRKRRLKFQVKDPRRLKRHKVIVKEAEAKFGLTWRVKAFYTNSTWYCAESNRIYSVTVSSSISRPLPLKRDINKEEHTKLVADLLSSIKCH
jgi:hypothetical protein